MANVLDRFRLDGKVALVTGGTRGLGQVISEALASAGARVALTSRTKDQAEGMASTISFAHGTETMGLQADVTRSTEVDAMVAATLDRFGRLDILVNNAGVNIRGPIERLTENDWDLVIDTNLKGPWLCCRAVAGPMKKQKWGRVINVSSMMGEITMPDRTPYSSSKGGLTLLTKTLALEWASHGINVNALCPGPFATEINTPLLNDPAVRAQMQANVPLGPLGRPDRAWSRRGLPRLGSLQLHDRRHAVHRRRLHGEVEGTDQGKDRLGSPAACRCPATRWQFRL